MTRGFAIGIIAAVLGAGAMLHGQSARSAEVQLKAAEQKAEVEGDLKGAIEQYKKLAQGGDRAVAAKALVRMAECYEKLGDTQSHTLYERVVREFSDLESAATARARLASMQSPTVPRPATRLLWNDVDESQYGPQGLSADGRYVSFVHGKSGDLAVRDLRESTTRRLTNRGSWDVASGDSAADSLVSPDGRQVAYAWELIDRNNGEFRGSYDLRVVSLSGEPSEPRIWNRSSESAYIWPVAWTPDGKSLMVVRKLRDSTWQIAVVSIAERSLRVLKSLEWRHPGKATLSPDGRFIAYDVPVATDVPTRDIFVLATDGSLETVMERNPANDHSPVWSPDGSQLLFVSNRTGSAALWSVSINAGKPIGSPELIRADIGQHIRGGQSVLGVTRSGTLYYVTGGRDVRNIYTVRVDANMKPTTVPAVATDRFINWNGSPGTSSDGQYLAYARQGPAGGLLSQVSPDPVVIVIRSLKTGEEREIRPGLLSTNGPIQWFPDQRSLLVRSPLSIAGLRNGFYRVDATSGRAELLLSVAALVGLPADLSPDGKSIFYIDSSASQRAGRLLRFDIESRRETEVAADGRLADVMSVAVSPDGAQLAFSSQSGWLEVMPLGGGEPRKVFRYGRFVSFVARSQLAWTPDQRYLLVVASEPNAAQELWRIPITGGEPEKVGLSVRGGLSFPQVDRGGRQITYQANEDRASELWALENFLPKKGATR